MAGLASSPDSRRPPYAVRIGASSTAAVTIATDASHGWVDTNWYRHWMRGGQWISAATIVITVNTSMGV